MSYASGLGVTRFSAPAHIVSHRIVAARPPLPKPTTTDPLLLKRVADLETQVKQLQAKIDAIEGSLAAINTQAKAKLPLITSKTPTKSAK
jgi:hypothetical protein